VVAHRLHPVASRKQNMSSSKVQGRFEKMMLCTNAGVSSFNRTGNSPRSSAKCTQRSDLRLHPIRIRIATRVFEMWLDGRGSEAKEGFSLLFQQKQPIVAWGHRPKLRWTVGRYRWAHPTFHKLVLLTSFTVSACQRGASVWPIGAKFGLPIPTYKIAN